MAKQKFIVEVWEHDRWSGVNLSHCKKYTRRSSAIRGRDRINAKNTAKVVPEVYLTAKLKDEN